MGAVPGQPTEGEPGIQRRPPGEPRVLSLGQQRLWYLDQLSPRNPVYNVPYFVRLQGPLQAEALRKALDAVVGRHEVLRTVILAPQGAPVPVLLRKWAVELKQVDLRPLPVSEREREAQRLIQQEAARPFHLARDLMMRGMLLRMADDEHIFFHVAPHMSFEGGSVGVLYRELAHFYEGFVSGQPRELPELPFQYCDYALWQRRSLEGERLEKLARFWKDQLTGAPVISLPADYPRPALQSMRGRRYSFVLPSGLLRAANEFFRQSKTSPYRGLLAAFNVFLHCSTRQDDFSVGSPFAPPRDLGLDNLIGFFVNTVVLRTKLAEDPTFAEVMTRVDQVVRRTIEHSELTFDKIVEAVRPPRDPSRGPLFQVNFRAPKAPYPALEIKGITSSSAHYADNGTAKFDLALEIESSRGEACYFEYSTDLFREATITQMVADFQTLLRALIAQPGIPLSQVPAVREISQRIGGGGGLRR